MERFQFHLGERCARQHRVGDPLLHSYDVVADLLMTAVLIVIVATGRYGPRQRSASTSIASCGTSWWAFGFRYTASFIGPPG
ncbi:MAG: hypothetical protein WDO73_11935 [Ignavibacteriota bacterium]